MTSAPLPLVLLVSAALGLPSAIAAPGNQTITVVGLDDSLVDRPAIQAALDAVAKNGTVELVGEFQLDGIEIVVPRSHVTVRGRALDDDGDGKVNEDWADGVDNDFDGAIDEDDWNALLKGLLAPDGTPEEGGTAPFFNRGFQVWGRSQVHVTDLKFTGLVRGVAFGGTTGIADSGLCSDTFPIGEVRNSSAERNLFENQNRAVQVFGGSHQVRIADNVVINHSTGIPLLLVGDEFGCVGGDGAASIGRPSRTIIEGNRISDALDGFTALFAVSADLTVVRNNEIELVVNGMAFQGARKGLVEHNRMTGLADDGVQVFEGLISVTGVLTDSEGLKIQNNRIVNAARWSIGLFDDVHGVKALHNDSVNPGAGDDYFLLDTSHDNMIVLEPGQTADDQGANNKIVGG